jgi:aspartokinase
VDSPAKAGQAIRPLIIKFMRMKVLKFGGSSVGTPENIKQVSNIISDYMNDGEKIIIVTSAMYGITNDLIEVGKAKIILSYLIE